MKEYIAPILQLAILGGFCLGIYKIANGRLKEKVSGNECHTAQKAIRDKIDTLDRHLTSHIDTRIDDLKDYIKRNGK